MIEIPPLLIKLKSKTGGGAFTVKVKDVVRVNPPPEPVTLIVYKPVGVEEEVVMVSWLVNVGFPEAGLKEGDTPEGNPDAERPTLSVDPETIVTVIVFEPEPP